jgi:phosphoribosylanthranilate isomerase
MENEEIIKICGIANIEDASHAIDLGYDILGVILDTKVVRHGTVDLIEKIRNMGGTTAAVYTSYESVKNDPSSSDYIQLHFSHSTEQITEIKDRYRKKIISVISYTGKENIDSQIQEKISAGADLVLVENREGIVKYLPGIEFASGNHRVGVAGKIRISNVSEIRERGFRFIDASSSLEISPGKKDHVLMKAFIERARCSHATV